MFFVPEAATFLFGNGVAPQDNKCEEDWTDFQRLLMQMQMRFEGPFDGKCPSNGMKLSELSTEPGYWRSNADSEIYSPCSKGYRGLNANALAEERCCPKKQTTNVSICKDLNFSGICCTNATDVSGANPKWQ